LEGWSSSCWNYVSCSKNIGYIAVHGIPESKLQEAKKFYESKVLMKRSCTGEDLIKTIYYLIDRKYETGQAIPVTGGQVMLK